MSKIKVTASTSIAKGNLKWNHISAHNNRSPKKELESRAKNGTSIKRSNQSINPEYTKYNKYGCLTSYDKFMDKPFLMAKLHKRNQKYIKSRHYKQCFLKPIDITGSKGRARLSKIPDSIKEFTYHASNGHKELAVDDLKGYLKSKDKKNTRCGIVTVGDTDFRNNLEHDLIHNHGWTTGECRQLEAQKLLIYMKNFNKRHNHIQIGHYAIHSDETFIHAHVEFMTLTSTKSGRPSFSFSKAIHDEYPQAKSNRLAFRKYRNVEDHTLVKQFSNGQFQLVRTHKSNHENRYQHSMSVSLSSAISSQKATFSSYKSNNSSFASSLSTHSEALDDKYTHSLSKLYSVDNILQSNFKTSCVDSASSAIEFNYNYASHSASSSAEVTVSSATSLVNSTNKSALSASRLLASKSSALDKKSARVARDSQIATSKMSKANTLLSKGDTLRKAIRAEFSADEINFHKSMTEYLRETEPSRQHYILHGFKLMGSYAKGFRSNISNRFNSMQSSHSASLSVSVRNADTPLAHSAQANHDNWVSEYSSLNANPTGLFMEDYDKLQSMKKAPIPMDSEDLIKSVSSTYHEPLYKFNSSISSSASSALVAQSINTKPFRESLAQSFSTEETRKDRIINSKEQSLKRSEAIKSKTEAQVRSQSVRAFNFRYAHDPIFKQRVDQKRHNNDFHRK